MSSSAPMEEIFWVKPSTPVPAQKLVLPATDQIGITIILPRICCFFRDEKVLSEERLVEALKVALAGTIAEYPHLCGKITYANEATRRIQLEIPEPEENTVQLKIKRHPEKSAHELARLNWPPRLLRREELCLSKWPTKAIGSYNFAIQANLIQGGLLLATHMNHVHFDGISHVMIETLLAHHLSRAIDGKPPKPSGAVTPAVLDKSVAWGTHPARPILEWEDWKPAAPPFKFEGMENMSEEEIMELAVPILTANFTLTVWKFTKEMQERIRREGQGPHGKLSLASCLHTFLWRIYVRARQHEPDTTTMCLTPVQTRGRVKELHPMWSGSALVYSRAKATAQEVLTVPKSELGYRIEAGTARWTSETVREYWGSIEDCENLADVQPNENRHNGTDVEFSNVSNFPFYRIPWGKGLSVESWRCTELAFSDAYVVLTPRSRNGDIEFSMLMTKDVLTNALEDPEWREYGEFVAAGDIEVEEQVLQALGRKPQAKL